MESMRSYKVFVMAESGDLFSRRELTLSPLFADALKLAPADAKLSRRKSAKWIDLGEGNLSPDYNPKQPHGGPSDLSAKAAFGWSKGFFEIALEVTDDVAAFPETPAQGWGFDSVQLYFDQLGNAAKEDSPYDADDISYCISLAGGKASAWAGEGCRRTLCRRGQQGDRA